MVILVLVRIFRGKPILTPDIPPHGEWLPQVRGPPGKVGGVLPSVDEGGYDHKGHVSGPGVSVLVVVVVAVVVLLPLGAILVAVPVLVVYERTEMGSPR